MPGRGRGRAELDVKTRFLQLGQQRDWSVGHEHECGFGFRSSRRLHSAPAHSAVFVAGWDRRGTGPFGTLDGELEIRAEKLDRDLFCISLRFANGTDFGNAPVGGRDEVLLRSFISVHSLLQFEGGEFASLIDPPQSLRDGRRAAAGTWEPGRCLVGEAGAARRRCCPAPIITFTTIRRSRRRARRSLRRNRDRRDSGAAQSSHDGRRKTEVRKSDDRAREILERTEAMPPSIGRGCTARCEDCLPQSHGETS